MTTMLFLSSTVVILFTSLLVLHRLRLRSSQIHRDAEAKEPTHVDLDASFTDAAHQLRQKLLAALPDIVITPENVVAFEKSMRVYWAKQACEVVPACVVRPRDGVELARAVGILREVYVEWRKKVVDEGRKEKNGERSKTENDEWGEKEDGLNMSKKDIGVNMSEEGLFAVRSGGHSPVAGASSIKGGALIDLTFFNEVTLAADRNTVVIGAGCKWVDVYKALEEHGLAVAGGRNSAVGVGGLTLGGGISFFSPRFGMVCSNIVEYEVVLADGSIVTASATSNPDLWRALKGGANNFGIVTRFTARVFPSSKIWSGFLYMHSSQAPKVLSSFHEFLNRVITNDQGEPYDEFAAGPIACFTYLQQLGIQAIAVALTHTKTPEDVKRWPSCWQTSSISRLWRFWSTCGVKSLAEATDEMSVLNPPGRRQEFATTTIRNDRDTLSAAHKAYHDAIVAIRKHNITNMSWTLVLQPLLPDWARKGDPNVLGLDNCTDGPLVVVSFTVNWAQARDDEMVQHITRGAIQQIDAFAAEHGTGHRYRYINYCGGWQSAFDGYGQDNYEFLREVSLAYDPEGLFQSGCIGGFKLGR
jgi:hypothetical protein